MNKIFHYATVSNLTLVVDELLFIQILVFWCRAFRIFLRRVINISVIVNN